MAQEKRPYGVAAEKIRDAWQREYDCSDLLSAAVGYYIRLRHQADEIPSVFIRNDEWKTPLHSLARIEKMMRTPTYDTIQFKNPQMVESFEQYFLQSPLHLCNSPSLSRCLDIELMLEHFAGGPGALYIDLVRHWPVHRNYLSKTLRMQKGLLAIPLAMLRPSLFGLLRSSRKDAERTWRLHGDSWMCAYREFQQLMASTSRLMHEQERRMQTGNPFTQDEQLMLERRLEELNSRQTAADIDPRVREFRLRQYAMREIPADYLR